MIKYLKSVLWRVTKRLSYIQDAWSLKVNLVPRTHTPHFKFFPLFAALVTIVRSLVTLLGSSYTGLDHSTSRIQFHNTAQFYSGNRLHVPSPCLTRSVASTLTDQPNSLCLLTFIGPCIVNTIPNYNQQDATFLDLFISTDALHVSGGSSAHHQEHITVHTASGIVNQYCC